jgi:heme oxygenase (mycobilin-producing)
MTTDTDTEAETSAAIASAPMPPAPAPATSRCVVALSRFTVANGMTSQVKEAFVNRPHLVDDAPGFLGMEVLCPFDNADEFWLMTRWADEPSYRAWHHSHLYRESHQGIPNGLKLVPGGTSIRLFERVCS